MATYLFNLTLIWLVSMVLFDIVLIREKHHAYNRAYLLLTLLAGCIVPFISRPAEVATTVQRRLNNLDTVRERLAADAPTVSGTQPDIYTLLLWVYLAGLAFGLTRVLKELIQLSAWYRQGNKRNLGTFLLIETGKQHGPFSFGNYIFVSTASAYTEAEWEMLLHHEQAHARYAHRIDLLLIQIVQLTLWFHPLVYWYRKRLILVHEFQADQKSAADPFIYGSFLLEQTLLQAGPRITHSFNCSPIKSRLTMLSKNQSRYGKLKFLVLLPLLGGVFVCCTAAKPSSERKVDEQKHTITFRGNVFGLPATVQRDTVVMDMGNGQQQMKVFEKDPYIPLSMNGTPIIEASEVTVAPRLKNGEDLPSLLFAQLRKQIEALPDGDYMFNLMNLVVDPAGKLVYFDMGGIYPNEQSIKDPKAAQLIEAINQSGERFLNEATLDFLPGTKNGKPVLCMTTAGFNLSRMVHVRNHNATY